MTIQEAHYQFKLLTNTGDTSTRPDFLPNQVDDYLYRGLLSFVKTNSQNLEVSQIQQDKLGNLLQTSPEKEPASIPTAITGGYYEIKLGNLSQPYYRLMKVQADIAGTCTKSKVKAYFHQKDDDYTAFTEPSASWGRVPYFIGESTTGTETYPIGLSVYLDTKSRFTIPTAYITYLRKPAKPFIGGYDHLDGIYLSATTPVDLDINSDFHEEVVRLAAQFALSDTTTQGLAEQIKMDKINLN